MDLINELLEKTKILSTGISELKKRGKRKAETEADYRIALASILLELRTAGHPVTIIGDIARGNREIAHLKLQRDIAETEYDVAQEFINVTKLQIKIIESQVNREWNNGHD